MPDRSVLVVGAGPTGLVLALELTQLGVPVRIIDKAPSAGTTSRAIAVQARTLELYRRSGLAEAVVAGGTKVAEASLWAGGRKVASVALSGLGRGLSPFAFALSFPQDLHEKLLSERLADWGVIVERDTELLGLEQRGDRVGTTIRRPNGWEETAECAFVAGCDGAGSTVRELCGIEFPGGTYAGVFYVADVDATGPAADGDIHVDLEEADFLAVFPLKKRGHVRLIGPMHDAGEHDRRLTFGDVGKRAIGNLGLSIVNVNWFSTYHVHHRVARHFRDDRVFLLGDAAHVHSPVGGQGMNTGIGDAVNLAWKLAAVLRCGARPGLLDTYEPERIRFARRLVATTDRFFTFVTRRGPLARRVRTRAFPALAGRVFAAQRARRYLFRIVSQIEINYRRSLLSAGAAGDVEGGDRLPWAPIAAGADNFDPLDSMGWQAHVYGVASPRLNEACSALRIPLHVFAWNTATRAAGLARDALYLIRPDSYVALADRAASPRRLRRYFEERGGELGQAQLRRVDGRFRPSQTLR